MLLVLCGTLVLCVSCLARLVPPHDPLNGVLDAELVVTVCRSPVDKTGKLFMVTGVFWGDAQYGDSIDLGDFKLRIPQREGDDIVEPITAETAILLYLQRSKTSPNQWEPTYYRESYFWTQRPEDYALLRLTAQRAVALRRKWEYAAAIPDFRQRLSALWPFWSFEYGVDFFVRTEEQLNKIAPPEFFDRPFPEDSNYPRERDYLTEEWHKKVRIRLQGLEHRYREHVSASDRSRNEVDGRKKETEEELAREIASGIYELSAAQNYQDLPLIRELAFLSAEYHQERIAYAALNALWFIREKTSLPAIEAILNAFRPDHKPGTWNSVVWSAEKLVCDYHYAEAVPLLATFVADEYTGKGAQFCLSETIGLDFGENPRAWIDWYQSEVKTASTVH